MLLLILIYLLFTSVTWFTHVTAGGGGGMVEIKTTELKNVAQEWLDGLLDIAEDAKVIIDAAHLDAMAWGLIGAGTVAQNYTPAHAYQAKQATGFINSLNGIRAGLLSVVIHYREAELASAQAAHETEKIMDLQGKLERDKTDLAEAQKKDQGLTD
ncbi:hypothetical protein [Streptosporangium sp. NPDC000396]|uniref:hypothetical protein n=1 Tax=Streptosporangium sp. NPDC000396 TaxID=3366185 RepID=UPI0036A65F49